MSHPSTAFFHGGRCFAALARGWSAELAATGGRHAPRSASRSGVIAPPPPVGAAQHKTERPLPLSLPSPRCMSQLRCGRTLLPSRECGYRSRAPRAHPVLAAGRGSLARARHHGALSFFACPLSYHTRPLIDVGEGFSHPHQSQNRSPFTITPEFA